jgi:hypothetical protein
MNIPASARSVKGRSHRARPVTCLLLIAARGVHLVSMGISTAPEQLIRLLPSRHPWPRHVFASSLAVHALGIALAGWATHGNPGTMISSPSQPVTRAYAVRYLVLNSPSTRPEPPQEHRPARPPVATVSPSAKPARSVSMEEPAGQRAPVRTPQNVPPPPTLEAEALAPGATVGVGQIVPTAHSDSTSVEPSRHGLDRLPELVGGTGSACPELRASATTPTGRSAVAVAFVVDTNGRVDPATLQVLESPGQPRTDHRFLTRVYVVGASLRVNRGRSPPTADDAVLTKEVASHVANLVFRPALLADRVIRSTVMVSCQTF